MVKFLDLAGLSALWNKIKLTFYTKAELEYDVMHDVASTISGDLTPEAAAQTVTVAPLSLTEALKAQVRSNIGLDTDLVISLLDDILGGVTLSVQEKSNLIAASGITLEAEIDRYYRFDTAVTELNIVLPTIENPSWFDGFMIMLTTGTDPNISFISNKNVYAQSGSTFESNTTYELNLVYNGNSWILATSKISMVNIGTQGSESE